MLRLCDQTILKESERKRAEGRVNFTRYPFRYPVSVLYAFQTLFGSDIIFLTGLMALIDSDKLSPAKEVDLTSDGFNRVLRKTGAINYREFVLSKSLHFEEDVSEINAEAYDNSENSEFEDIKTDDIVGSDVMSSVENDSFGCDELVGSESADTNESTCLRRESNRVPTLRECAEKSLLELLDISGNNGNEGSVFLIHTRDSTKKLYEVNSSEESGNGGDDDEGEDDDNSDDEVEQGLMFVGSKDGNLDQDVDGDVDRMDILNNELDKIRSLSDCTTINSAFLIHYLRFESLLELNYPKSDLLSAITSMETVKSDLIFEEILLTFVKRKRSMSRWRSDELEFPPRKIIKTSACIL